MKQAIRALSVATTALWILIVLFSVTSIYSALKLGFGFERTEVSASDDVLTVSMSFFVDNVGFYDISNLNVTTDLNNHDGTLISNSTTLVPLISRGSRVERAHNISISMDDIVTGDLTDLLFQDSVLDIAMYVSLKYAHAIPLQLSFNTTIPWGAPLANLSIGEITTIDIDPAHLQKTVPISFENHSFFALNGTVRLELVDRDQSVGAGTVNISVPPMTPCSTQVEVVVRRNAAVPTKARIYFETAAFSFGPVVMPLG